MKKKVIAPNKLFDFTPNVVEMEKIFKKYPAPNAPVPTLLKTEKGFLFKSQNGKESSVFSYANEFENGYAFVMEYGDCHYIDSDFVPVLYEDKIKTSEDLATVISLNPDGVKKYVSPERILSVRDNTAFELLTSPGTKNKGIITQALDKIQKFITKNNLEEAFA